MVAISSEIKGLPELAKNSAKLKKSFARSTLRTALRNAAKPVVKGAQDRVPVAPANWVQGPSMAKDSRHRLWL